MNQYCFDRKVGLYSMSNTTDEEETKHIQWIDQLYGFGLQV